MVSDEALDKIGVTMIILTILNILVLIVYMLFSAYTEQQFSDEMSTMALGAIDLVINISNICYIDLGIIIFQLIFLFIVSNKKQT